MTGRKELSETFRRRCVHGGPTRRVGWSRRWLAQVVSVIEAEQAVRAMSCKLVELAELGPGDSRDSSSERTGSASQRAADGFRPPEPDEGRRWMDGARGSEHVALDLIHRRERGHLQ